VSGCGQSRGQTGRSHFLRVALVYSRCNWSSGTYCAWTVESL